ncbi:MAG: DUF1573 domain-containing protein [Kiritimatiellia bacterium]|jgi:hypothetical protein|nr:DUF1573 domain-containing protein [Candidatus Paceibacterota bacterium]MDY0145622.1 DUF1573 domain-containing protein [Kiritimatiellia bacterium]
MKSLSTALFIFMGLIPALHATPKLVVAPETFDYGEAPSGESVQATFTLRNEGDEPLTITHVRTSCGCTTTALETRDLAPGEETPLVATLSLKGRTGPQNKRITIGSNDPEFPSRQATIQGTAVRHLLLSPSAIFFLSAPQGKTITRTIELLSETRVPFKILSIEASHPDLAIGVEPLSASAYRLSLTLPPTWPAGRIDESLRIHTDHPKAPLLTCGIIGTMQTQETNDAPIP